MATSRLLHAQLFFAGFLLTATACTDSPPGMVIDPYLEAIEADYIIFGLRSYLTRNGIREAIVEADTALVFQDSTVVFLRGHVRLTAYNEELGTEKAVVTSDRGRLDTDTNELFAEGNAVLVIQADGRRIESYELRYIPDANRIQSDSTTVMYDGDTTIEGTSFTSDLDFTNVVIQNGRTLGGSIRF